MRALFVNRVRMIHEVARDFAFGRVFIEAQSKIEVLRRLMNKQILLLKREKENVMLRSAGFLEVLWWWKKFSVQIF